MNDASPPPPNQETGTTSRQEAAVDAALGVGCILGFTGIVVGLRMAFIRKEGPCKDGTFFPEGTTDFTCYVHPRALEGTAVAVISLMLAIVLVLVAVTARAVLASQPREGSAASNGDEPRP